ncbi:deoxyribodipyrimidine photolyase [Candidatus Peregrinibacteria bacterium HGW-Peregrinibacteria-1]|jgi:deoxyribodipyrimidine photo-lyase|nr:MAG: deoxyribodipyrimidine photolyase [Candidatus Peregrinibacteria bacterium HGW-Peregrinibacteria-1]
MVDSRRVQVLNTQKVGSGPVIYWMSRDQRVDNNWALIYAQELAVANDSGVVVVFCLNPSFWGATVRQYEFLLKGLEEVEKDLRKLNIPFSVLLGVPNDEIVLFAKKIKAGAVVTDFDPLRIKTEWKQRAASSLGCALFHVDAHNIVPCWQASPKQEFGAYTIRPKINRVLSEYLTVFPKVKTQKNKTSLRAEPIDWNRVRSSLNVDKSVAEVAWLLPGKKAGRGALKTFIDTRLDGYADGRNDPNLNLQSGLSPYLHFGQLSAQYIALAVQSSGASVDSKEAFLEELIVRRELSDNYCYYNSQYDSFMGFPNWARASLDEHRDDKREYLYSLEDFEAAKTHDALWNAAQLEMVTEGKMHGYMRMYWAKKILEWSESPEMALEIAIYLNDKYELDGRDPNGYSGIAWSIGGLHDRAWFDRPVFGKVRYMNYNGCKSKFDVDAYIAKMSEKN